MENVTARSLSSEFAGVHLDGGFAVAIVCAAAPAETAPG